MPFGSLWIPVVVSAIVVFVGSSILHMALKYHKADYRAIPAEESVRQTLDKAGATPGLYMTPHCADMKQMKEPAFMEKYEKGPVAVITILPKGAPNMGKHLGLWFGFSLLVSFVSAYIARHTLQPGADGMLVMQITGTVAFAGYSLSHLSDSIWKGQPWGNTVRALIDGLIYAVLTGATFRLLWPAA
jgi:hypothetical protein